MGRIRNELRHLAAFELALQQSILSSAPFIVKSIEIRSYRRVSISPQQHHSPQVGYEAQCVWVVVGDLLAVHVLHIQGAGRGVGIADGLVLLGLVLVARRRQIVRQVECRWGTIGHRLVVKNLTKEQRLLN